MRPRSSAARSSSRRRSSPAVAGRQVGSSSRRRPRSRVSRSRHPRSGHQGPRRAPSLDRDRVGHREGVLPLADLRSRRQEAAVHVHDAGRSRDRAGRGGEPGRPRASPRRSSRGLQPVAVAPARVRRGRRRSVGAEADRQDHRPALRRLRPLRRDALRGKPADRDARRRRQGARLEVHRRRQRAVPSSLDRRDARRRGRRSPRGARPREERDVRQARRRGRGLRKRRWVDDVDRRRRHLRRWPTRQLL